MDSDNCFWFEVVRIRSLQTIFRIYVFSHASRLENILFKRLVCTVQSTRSYVPSLSCDKKNVYLFVYLFLAIIVRSAIYVFLLFVFQSLWLQFRSATAANVNAFVEYSIFVLSFLANIVRSATVVFLFVVFYDYNFDMRQLQM